MKELTQDEADDAFAYAYDASEAAPFDVKVELTDHSVSASGFENMIAGMRELGMHSDAEMLEQAYNDAVSNLYLCKKEMRKHVDLLNKRLKTPARKFAKKAQKTWY